MGKKIDKAAGVKVAPVTAKKGKEVTPPKKFVATDAAIKDAAITEVCLLRERIAELEKAAETSDVTISRLCDERRELTNVNKSLNKELLGYEQESNQFIDRLNTRDNKISELTLDLEKATGVNIDYQRKIQQISGKMDLLKDDCIMITKAFCLVK